MPVSEPEKKAEIKINRITATNRTGSDIVSKKLPQINRYLLYIIIKGMIVNEEIHTMIQRIIHTRINIVSNTNLEPKNANVSVIKPLIVK